MSPGEDSGWWGYKLLKALVNERNFLLRLIRRSFETISFQEKGGDLADQVDQHILLAGARADIERAKSKLRDVFEAEARIKSGSGETVENLISLLENALIEVEAIEVLLQKIYACEECERSIEIGRLMVVPQTKHCAACATRLASQAKPQRVRFITSFV